METSGGIQDESLSLDATFSNNCTMNNATITTRYSTETRDSVGSSMSEAELDNVGRLSIASQPGCKISIYGKWSQVVVITPKLDVLLFLLTQMRYGYNIGNHYNLTNGTFTAPVDGRYLVISSINVIGDNIAYIYKNG